MVMVEEKLKKTAVFTAIFAVLSLSVMFYRAATKNIMIAEATKTESNTVSGQAITLEIQKPTSDKGKGTLVIPLENGVTSENITFEEKHAEHEFLLYIKGKSPEFYDSNSPISDLALITGAEYIKLNDSGSVCLKFNLDGLYENETALEDKEIIVTFKSPEELYEKVVIIDPVDNIGIDIIKFIKKQMDGDDSIRIYYTRQNADEPESDAAAALISESAADFYIRVGADTSDDGTSGIKTYYNSRYFIREFGNVEFADQLEKYTATCAGAEALGLFEISEDDIYIMNSKIPSAFVAVGDKTKDKSKLSDDKYLEGCASGILAGIKAAFAITDPEDETENSDALQEIINSD